MILNKNDLLPYLDFDVDQTIEHACRVNPDLEIIMVSAKTGEGVEAWADWIVGRLPPAIET